MLAINKNTLKNCLTLSRSGHISGENRRPKDEGGGEKQSFLKLCN